MVTVLMKLTPITVKARSRSEFSCLGSTAEVAIAAQRAMPGAALRRLSGAHRRTMSTAMLLGIEHGHQLTLVDRLAFAHLDFLDRAGLGRQHRNLHLHRFQDHDLAFDLDLVAGLELDLPDIAGDFRLHVDDGHVLFFPRGLPQAFSASARAKARAATPVRAPSRWAVGLTAEIIPSC